MMSEGTKQYASDSWGIELITEYLGNLMSITGQITDDHNDNQDKHQLEDSKEHKTVKDVSKNKVVTKVVRRVRDDRYTELPSPSMDIWCKERQIKGYGTKIVKSKSINFIEKIKVEGKQSMKGSEKAPAQVESMKGSELAPAQVVKSPPTDSVKEIKLSVKEPSFLPSDALENDSKFENINDEVNLTDLILIRPKIGVEISTVIDNDKEDTDEKIETDDHEEIPPLSEYDLEDDQEDGQAIGENNLTLDTEKTISWAVSQSSLQAHVTSNKPKDNRSCSKKALKIKKLEVIRKGAILPDNIWLSNHMSNTCMSKEDYNNRCESLKKICNKIVKCNAHTSLENLRKISKGLKEILSQTDVFTEDWDRNKKILSGKYGYLNIAVNYPEILRETKLIRNLIKSFNSSRENLRKYRDIILSYNKKKPNLFKLRTTTKKIKTANKDASNEKKVLARLVEKLNPYSERDFKIISSRAFLSVHVREIFLEWEKDNLQPFGITEASKEAIDNLKFEYPNLQKWDYFKIMDRISENWVNRDIIQSELNKEVLENAKIY